MNDFFRFYQDGGLFMHFISAAGLFGGVALRKALKRQDLVGQLQIMSTMAKAAVLVGILGTAMGGIELFHVLGHQLGNLPVNKWLISMARGSRVSLHPVVWGMMVGIPLVVAEGLLRRHVRSAPASTPAD